VDSITGTTGNDSVKAVVSATAGESTLTLADSIEGGAGTDTLTLTVSGAAVLPAADIKNVENIFIKDLTGGNTHSFANVAGEARVIVTGSTGNTTVTGLDNAAVGVQSMTAAATQTFTFKDTAFAAGGTVNIVADGAGSVVAATAATIAVGTASVAGAATAATIEATGTNLVTLTSGADAAHSVAAPAGIKTLNVTGSGVLSLTSASTLVFGSTLAADLTTLNASANTGGVTAQVDKTTVKVTGGAGNDKISVGGAMTTGASFLLGAGNDQLLAAAGGSLDDKVVVDGGDGIDTVASGLITVANGAIFKNFEKIALSTSSTTTDIELLTGSTVSGLLVNTGDITAVVALNVANNSTVEVTAVDATQTGTLTLGVKGAAASTTDVLNVSFNGAAQVATPAAYNIAGGTMTAANVETINVASGGADNTWNQLALTADKLKNVVVTGAKNLDLTFVGTNGTNPVATQGGAVSSIDGSAATGKLNINLANVVYDDKIGFTLKGGTGNDTITTNASSSTLTGTGGNDKYIVTATVAGTADVTTAKVTSITDINAGDSIALTTLTALTKAQTTIAAATNLTNAIDLALKNAAVTANTAAWFQYGGNTYVVTEDATDGFGGATTSDVIVKLTGLVDLTNATVGSNAITLV